MGNSVRLLLFVVTSLALTSFLGPAPASAGGLCSSLILTCEDGRTYPFCPIAVSEEGEIATGYLTLSPRHGLHMPWVPTGPAYRSIAPGASFTTIPRPPCIYSA